MARLKINDFVTIGVDKPPVATSWQVAIDPNFTKIVDESLLDEDNILEWITPLKKIGTTDQYYKDMDKLYARFKLHFDLNNTSKDNWFNMNVGNQNMQELVFVKDGEIVKTVSPEDSLLYS